MTEYLTDLQSFWVYLERAVCRDDGKCSVRRRCRGREFESRTHGV